MATHEPDGPADCRLYLSYAAASQERLGSLLERLRPGLEDALRARLGPGVGVWLDMEGRAYRAHLRRAPRELALTDSWLLPVLTPEYMTSEGCVGELRRFLADAGSAIIPRIQPLRLQAVPAIDDLALHGSNQLAARLHGLHPWPLLELPGLPRSGARWQATLQRLADHLARLIAPDREPLAPGAAPPPPTPMAPAPAPVAPAAPEPAPEAAAPSLEPESEASAEAEMPPPVAVPDAIELPPDLELPEETPDEAAPAFVDTAPEPPLPPPSALRAKGPRPGRSRPAPMSLINPAVAEDAMRDAANGGMLPAEPAYEPPEEPHEQPAAPAEPAAEGPRLLSGPTGTRGDRRADPRPRSGEAGMPPNLLAALLAGLSARGRRRLVTGASLLVALAALLILLPSRCDSEPEGALQDCAACPPLVRVPAGIWQPDTSELGPDRPLPLAPTEVPAFALGRAEVTNGEWQACVAEGACPALADAAAARPDQPASGISAHAAAAYIAWLRQTTGRDYRLPGALEWEYAARAGEVGISWWPGLTAGSGAPPYAGPYAADQAHWRDHRWPEADAEFPPLEALAVGDARFTRPPNAFELQDMAGNLWEWVGDCALPAGAPAEACRYQAIRGGSFADRSSEPPAMTLRGATAPIARLPILGLRVARPLEPPSVD